MIDIYKMCKLPNKANINTNKNYRNDIDGLRALAIIAVIFNHFNKEALPSGYLGVDIFFCISGFVITSSILAKSFTSFKDLIISFYEKRVRRLIPAQVVFVLLTSILICIFNPYPGVSL